MPFWSKKPTLEDQVIDLRMSSKMMDNQYKRCMKESVVYEKKMKAEIAKGNQDSAKLYAESAVRLKAQGKQFMILSARVQAAALTLQSMSSMSGVSNSMATSVRAIKSASQSLDLSRMYKVMDDFKTACEDNNVMMAGFTTAMGEQTAENFESAEALYQQAAMEYANASGDKIAGAPLGDVVTSNPTAVPNSNADLISRLVVM